MQWAKNENISRSVLRITQIMAPSSSAQRSSELYEKDGSKSLINMKNELRMIPTITIIIIIKNIKKSFSFLLFHVTFFLLFLYVFLFFLPFLFMLTNIKHNTEMRIKCKKASSSFLFLHSLCIFFLLPLVA